MRPPFFFMIDFDESKRKKTIHSIDSKSDSIEWRKDSIEWKNDSIE